MSEATTFVSTVDAPAPEATAQQATVQAPARRVSDKTFVGSLLAFVGLVAIVAGLILMTNRPERPASPARSSTTPASQVTDQVTEAVEAAVPAAADPATTPADPAPGQPAPASTDSSSSSSSSDRPADADEARARYEAGEYDDEISEARARFGR